MSITIKNLEAAFAGESQAFTKYMYFAKIARAQPSKLIIHIRPQNLMNLYGINLLVLKIFSLVGRTDLRRLKIKSHP